MAKFKKSRVAATHKITLQFNIDNQDTGEKEIAVCSHVFTRPTGRQMIEHRQRAIKTRGRKIKSQQAEANFWLWQQCIVQVFGYEEDGISPEATKVELFAYFDDDDIGRIHAEEFITSLLLEIQAEDADTEKKSAPSSGVSSGQPLKTPMSSTK